MRHLFIIPTTSCQASCKYCFTPNTKSPVMSMGVLEKGLILFANLLSQSENSKKKKITFHGGEPLLAGIDFYKKALPKIYEILGNNVNIGMQSNLWALNEAFLSLLSEYSIGISTSIDGPEHINDTQRCTGYFVKTFSGIEMLHRNGISPGCIATFTKYSANHYRDVFDFFLNNNMHFSVHGAMKPIGNKKDPIYLDADEYAQLLTWLLNLYLKNLESIKIDTLDTMIKNVANDESGLCTFSRCTGDYLAVTPEGELYSCNRFIGNKAFSLGNVNNTSGIADIEHSPGWQRLIEWQEAMDKECEGCLHKNICHGGCPYAGISAGNGKPSRDPFCKAYKKVYSYILDKATDEFFSEKNMNAIKVYDDENLTQNQKINQKLLRGGQGGGFLEKRHHAGAPICTALGISYAIDGISNPNRMHVPRARRRQNGKSSLFREGSLLKIMNDEPHPYDIKRNARIILASAFLGAGRDLDQVADFFVDNALSKSRDGTLSALKRLHGQIVNPSGNFNNLYIHITNRCDLSCSFCYANAGSNGEQEFLPVDKITGILEEASTVGFRKVVITGGEPLTYKHFSSLVRGIKRLKTGGTIPPVVLRTNLTREFDNDTVNLVAETFAEIVVSLDGSKEYHDAKRGKGTYEKVMKNLRRFDEKTLNKKMSLAAVFDFKNTPKEIIESEKQYIKETGDHLGIKKIRFLPLLPLGRAGGMDLSREKAEPMTVSQWTAYGYSPGSSCGIGYVIMINPDGNVYPCHIYAHEHYNLGNIYEENLKEIIASPKYWELRDINVDKIVKCRDCDMRYLCGGGCRVWKNEECRDLYERARGLVDESIKILGLKETIKTIFFDFPRQKMPIRI